MAEKKELALGELLIKRNVVPMDQVQECIEIQEKLRMLGEKPKKLGELLIEKGYITEEKLKAVLGEQEATGTVGKMPDFPGYRIIGRIGRGGMGTVYKAIQLSMDRMVALKVLTKDYAKDSDTVTRFFREVKLSAQLNHPNIVAAFDAGEHNSTHFYVMEFVDGETLSEMIRRRGRLSEKEVVNIGIGVASALEHAYRAKIVHRDIKPSNIMVTKSGMVKLCDLGIAKKSSGEDPSLTQDGIAVGTPHYISPEQAKGEKVVDARADIYSLGATMYHAVTGKTVFDGPNAMAIITKHVTEPPKPPKQYNSELTDSFNHVILKCIRKKQGERYQTPADLLTDLQKLAKGVPVVPTSTSRYPATRSHHRPVAQPQEKQKSPMVMAGIVLVVLLGLGVVGYFASRPDPVKPTPNGTNPVVTPTEDPIAKKFKTAKAEFERERERLIKAPWPVDLIPLFGKLDLLKAEYTGTDYYQQWVGIEEDTTNAINSKLEDSFVKDYKSQIEKLCDGKKFRQALDIVEAIPHELIVLRASPLKETTLSKMRSDWKNDSDRKWRDYEVSFTTELYDCITKGEFDRALEMTFALNEVMRNPSSDRVYNTKKQIVDAYVLKAGTSGIFSRAALAESFKWLDGVDSRYKDLDLGRMVDVARKELFDRFNERVLAARSAFNTVYKSKLLGDIEKALYRRDIPAARKVVGTYLDSYTKDYPDTSLAFDGIDIDQIKARIANKPPTDSLESGIKWCEAQWKTFMEGPNKFQPLAELLLDVRACLLIEHVLNSAAGYLVQEKKGQAGTDDNYYLFVQLPKEKLVLSPLDQKPKVEEISDYATMSKLERDADYLSHESALLFFFTANYTRARELFDRVNPKSDAFIGVEYYRTKIINIKEPPKASENLQRLRSLLKAKTIEELPDGTYKFTYDFTTKDQLQDFKPAKYRTVSPTAAWNNGLELVGTGLYDWKVPVARFDAKISVNSIENVGLVIAHPEGGRTAFCGPLKFEGFPPELKGGINVTTLPETPQEFVALRRNTKKFLIVSGKAAVTGNGTLNAILKQDKEKGVFGIKYIEPSATAEFEGTSAMPNPPLGFSIIVMGKTKTAPTLVMSLEIICVPDPNWLKNPR